MHIGPNSAQYHEYNNWHIQVFLEISQINMQGRLQYPEKLDSLTNTVKTMVEYSLTALTLSRVSVRAILHQYIVERLFRATGKVVHSHLYYPVLCRLTPIIPTIDHTRVVVSMI